MYQGIIEDRAPPPGIRFSSTVSFTPNPHILTSPIKPDPDPEPVPTTATTAHMRPPTAPRPSSATPSSSAGSMALIQHPRNSDSRLTILGTKLRAMVDLVNRLRTAGVDKLNNLPLPRIAVIGNQSAGKSSLIEAISGIKVPRYTGTCTRVSRFFLTWGLEHADG